MMALKLRLLFSTSNCSAKNVELSLNYQGTDSEEESEGVRLGVRRIRYGQKTGPGSAAILKVCACAGERKLSKRRQ
jgi:hypothetical protein